MTTIVYENKSIDVEELFIKAFEAAVYAAEMRDDNPYCGFAWVVVKTRANSVLGKFLRDPEFAKKWGITYHEGEGIHINSYPLLQTTRHAGTQSMDVKEAACDAFAKVLTEGGIPCYASSRPD